MPKSYHALPSKHTLSPGRPREMGAVAKSAPNKNSDGRCSGDGRGGCGLSGPRVASWEDKDCSHKTSWSYLRSSAADSFWFGKARGERLEFVEIAAVVAFLVDGSFEDKGFAAELDRKSTRLNSSH